MFRIKLEKVWLKTDVASIQFNNKWGEKNKEFLEACYLVKRLLPNFSEKLD